MTKWQTYKRGENKVLFNCFIDLHPNITKSTGLENKYNFLEAKFTQAEPLTHYMYVSLKLNFPPIFKIFLQW